MNTNFTPSSLLSYAAAAALLIPTIGCDVKKTQDGEAPQVKVEGGKLPKYDVETADVSVGKKQTEVTVPKVTSEKKTLTVPDINVTTPSEKRAAADAAAAPAPAAPAPPATPVPPQ